MNTKTTATNEIEVLTMLSVTSLTPDGNLWSHRDLKGREFSDIRKTLSSHELIEQTNLMDFVDTLEMSSDDCIDPDFDAADDGFGWERAALASAHARLY